MNRSSPLSIKALNEARRSPDRFRRDALPIRVTIISDVRFYRDGLEQVLPGLGAIEVTGTDATVNDALASTACAQADVVVLDANLPNGLEAVRELRRTHPQASVLAAAVGHDEESIVRWAEAGVAGFITREQSLSDVARMIESVAGGEAPCDGRIGTALLRCVNARACGERLERRPRLTRREREVAELLAAGLSNKEIAARLHIELPTVKHHVRAVLGKLALRRRAEVAARLLRD
jgi:two-component system nitrate/nitrite response regulator NarL